jgi:hypothetical protein
MDYFWSNGNTRSCRSANIWGRQQTDGAVTSTSNVCHPGFVALWPLQPLADDRCPTQDQLTPTDSAAGISREMFVSEIANIWMASLGQSLPTYARSLRPDRHPFGKIGAPR